MSNILAPAPLPPRMRRAMVRYHGGKHQLAPWIAGHLRPHRVYVEPFGGSASVLMRKARSEVEVLADLDTRLVGLYRTMSSRLRSVLFGCRVRHTPYGRETLHGLKDPPTEGSHPDSVGAFDIVVRGAMARSTSDGAGYRGETVRNDKNRTSAATDWARYQDSIPDFHKRLQGVVLRHGDAIDVMREFDAVDALHYVDPPYHPLQRSRHGYRHDLDVADHVRLVEFLQTLKGMVVLSGYSVPLYDEGLVGWTRFDKISPDNNRKKRVESVWLNPSAVAARQPQLALF